MELAEPKKGRFFAVAASPRKELHVARCVGEVMGALWRDPVVEFDNPPALTGRDG